MTGISKKAMRLDIFRLIGPILISSMLEMTVGIVSMALIGNLGGIAIGAMGLSMRVRGLIWAAYKGIAIGVQVVVAQALGAENHDKIKKAIAQTVGSIAVVSLVFLISMWLYPNYWLGLFGASGELLYVSMQLLKVVSIGFPFLGTVIIVSGALQGKGDAKTPMIINGLMNILNIILGLILVKGLFGFPEMGLIGAGIAMTISQGVAALVALYVLSSKKGVLGGVPLTAFVKFSKNPLKSVYATGIPSALESLFWQLSSVLLIRAIMTYGEDVYAAYQLGLQAESLAYMPAAGFQVAATAYVGKYLGAGKPQYAKQYFKEIVVWAIGVSALGGGLLVFIPGVLLGIMTKDTYLIQIATVYLIFCGVAQIPQNVASVLGGAIRGGGYTKYPMYTAGIGLYLVRVPLAYVAAYWMNWSIHVIFLAIAIDMCVRLILNSYLYKKINIYENPRLV